MMASPHNPIRRDHLVVHEVEDELLLYDPQVDRSHRLNVTAAAIFRACDGQSDVDDIAQQISQSFDIDEDTALADTRDILRQMACENLLVDSGTRQRGGP